MFFRLPVSGLNHGTYVLDPVDRFRGGLSEAEVPVDDLDRRSYRLAEHHKVGRLLRRLAPSVLLRVLFPSTQPMFYLTATLSTLGFPDRVGPLPD